MIFVRFFQCFLLRILVEVEMYTLGFIYITLCRHILDSLNVLILFIYNFVIHVLVFYNFFMKTFLEYAFFETTHYGEKKRTLDFINSCYYLIYIFLLKFNLILTY